MFFLLILLEDRRIRIHISLANGSGSGLRIEIRNTALYTQLNLMYILDEVYAARDINTVELFSYNQFYVLYVKFMGLDRDGDFCLLPADLKGTVSGDCSALFLTL
jgi:hypothetical protein